MTETWLLLPLIFFARIVDVALGTVRMILIVAGLRWISGAIGFVEVTIWALAVGGLVANLSNPLTLVAYAGGFAAGTVIGIYLEEWIALGLRIVRVIDNNHGRKLCEQLRQQGHRVTCLSGRGGDGPVEVAFSIIRRRELTRFQNAVRAIAPDAWISVERVEQASSLALGSEAYRRRRSLFGIGALRK